MSVKQKEKKKKKEKKKRRRRNFTLDEERNLDIEREKEKRYSTGQTVFSISFGRCLDNSSSNSDHQMIVTEAKHKGLFNPPYKSSRSLTLLILDYQKRRLQNC